MLEIWKEGQFDDLEKRLFIFVKFVSLQNRKDSVEVVGALIPVFIHFRGPEIVPELYRAIQDTARWWQ